jgi:glutamate racemase
MKMDNSMIGIFDAGVGGLSVLKAMEQITPGYAIGYLADCGRFPYSPRPLSERLAFSLQDAEFLVEQGAEAIVIACNSITCFAGEPIRERVKVPIFDVISSGVKAAVAATKTGHVGIIGSVQTGNSPIYPDAIAKIAPEVKVTILASQIMVYLVEEGVASWSEVKPIVKRILTPLIEAEIDTLVLGCTHFPFFKDAIAEAVGPKVTLVDPGIAVAEDVRVYLKQHPDLDHKLNQSVSPVFYVSGSADKFIRIAADYYGRINASNVIQVEWP